MPTLTANHFDVHDFIKKSKELGASEELAEFQARQIEAISEVVQLQQQQIDVLNKFEPATKQDLGILKLELQKEIQEVQKEIEIVRKEIALASNKTLLLMGTFGIFFLGVLAKGFHWF